MHKRQGKTQKKDGSCFLHRGALEKVVSSLFRLETDVLCSPYNVI